MCMHAHVYYDLIDYRSEFLFGRLYRGLGVGGSNMLSTFCCVGVCEPNDMMCVRNKEDNPEFDHCEELFAFKGLQENYHDCCIRCAKVD